MFLFQLFQIKTEKSDFFNLIYTIKTNMKKMYIIELIEPDTNFNMHKYRKQKCNFCIEVIQIKIDKNGKIRKKEF